MNSYEIHMNTPFILLRRGSVEGKRPMSNCPNAPAALPVELIVPGITALLVLTYFGSCAGISLLALDARGLEVSEQSPCRWHRITLQRNNCATYPPKCAQLIARSGNELKAHHANAILPVRADGNFTLCIVLIGEHPLRACGWKLIGERRQRHQQRPRPHR